MRKLPAIALALVAAALVSACGKSEPPVMPSSAPVAAETPAPAATPPTADQLKRVAALPAPYNTGDPARGEEKFALCHTCHLSAKGAPNLTGPDLWGVFGTKAAQVPGFDFSDGLKKSGLTYDAPTLDKWITDPRVLVPDTKMTFAGVKDPKDRIDIIAYLATQRDP